MAHLETFSQFVVRNPSQFSPISTIRACFFLLLFKITVLRWVFFTEVNCIIEPEDSEKTFVQPLPLINFFTEISKYLFYFDKKWWLDINLFFLQSAFHKFSTQLFYGRIVFEARLIFLRKQTCNALTIIVSLFRCMSHATFVRIDQELNSHDLLKLISCKKARRR